MIGSEEDDGVVVDLLLNEGHDKPSDLVIQMGDAGVVADLGLPDQFRINRACLGVKDTAVTLEELIGLPGANERFAQILVFIEVEVMLRRVQRRMGPQVGGHQEEGLVRVPAPEEIQAPVRHPVGGVIFLLMGPGTGHPAVAVNACIRYIGVGAQFLPEPVEVVVRHKLGLPVGNVAVAGRVEIAS